MKFGRWIVVLALGAVGAAAACADPPQSQATEGADRVAEAPQAAIAPADTNVVFVDVRTDQEWEAGHVAGAIHIPHTEMEARHDELEQYEDKQIVVYCRSGRRSGIAMDILESEGFDNVTNGGGLVDLRAQGVSVSPDCC